MKPQRSFLSVEDYLARELGEPGRHEYVNGQAYALSGASLRHGIVVTNLVRHTANAAERLQDCRVFSQGTKVFAAARNSFYYPDVVASCESGDGNEYVVREPCFIVEVLSPSTASIDRREKRAAYMTIDSLTEYIVLEQERMRADVYRRSGDGWNLYSLRQPENIVEFTCLELGLTLEQIYKGVDLPLCVSEPEEAACWVGLD